LGAVEIENWCIKERKGVERRSIVFAEYSTHPDISIGCYIA